jgi:hypothetical protein
VFTIVESGAFDWRLIEKQNAYLRVFVPRSVVDAKREDLHVEAEAVVWITLRDGPGTNLGVLCHNSE